MLDVPRKDYVVSTKLIKVGLGPNDIGLSRKRVIEGTRACLKRLQLDYVDIIFAHRPDYQTPMEEIVRGFSWLIDNGLAFYWGTSEWTPTKFEEACQVAERLKLHAPVAEQCQYNMFVRDRFEKDHMPLFDRRNIGTTIWSPLAGGILTGKYNDGNIPEGSRVELMYKTGGHLSKRADAYFSPENKDKFVKVATALGDLAKELGFTQAQLALAWSVATKDTSTAILGFSRLSQIDENVQAIKLLEQWTPELEKRTNEILGNCPVLETDWRTWQTPMPRRLR
jgi:aryl-alcohol dehydrogenase-like predicted oxidoreductase